MQRTFLILIPLCAALAACSSARPPAASHPATPPQAATHAPAADVPGRPNRDVLAIVDGQPVTLAMLEPALIEASGGTVLAEWLLDRKVAEALHQRNFVLSREEIDREKAVLLEQLSEDRDQAARLLTQLREARGLGARRFEALLRRNAGLRKLVAGEVTVTDPLLREAWSERYGERTEVRLILTNTLPEAARAMERARSGESFADLAIALSRDSSRNQGGLLPPISPQDASFPKAIRDVAARLKPGEVSEPVALEGGFAILKCERKIAPQDIPFEKVADDLRRRVRLGLERTLMQRQARVLLQGADVTALDPTLNETWKRQRQQLLDNN